jgi:hypothetical protein
LSAFFLPIVLSIIIDIIMLRLSFNKVHFFAGFKNILKRAEASAFCPKNSQKSNSYECLKTH